MAQSKEPTTPRQPLTDAERRLRASLRINPSRARVEYFEKLAESAESFITGDGVTTEELFDDWMRDFRKSSPSRATAKELESFFHHQRGVDELLKYWHIGIFHFPDFDKILAENTQDKLTKWMRANKDASAKSVSDIPKGTADKYLRLGPGGVDCFPIRIVDTRELDPEDVFMAASVVMNSDPDLAAYPTDWFPWNDITLEELPISSRRALYPVGRVDNDEQNEAIQNRSVSEAYLVASKSNWFTPRSEMETARLNEPIITVVSNSVVRTLNFYLESCAKKKFRFDVNRIEEIGYRGNKWPTPQSIKNFRMDWRATRTLEEAALLLGATQPESWTQTKVLEEFIINSLGNFVAKQLADDSLNASDEKRQELEDTWANFRLATTSLGAIAHKNLKGAGDSPSHVKSNVGGWMDEANVKMDELNRLYNFIAGVKKAQPAFFPGGENEPTILTHAVMLKHYTKGDEHLTEEVNRVSANLNHALMNPIDFRKCRPTVAAASHTIADREGKVNHASVDNLYIVFNVKTVKGDSWSSIVDGFNEAYQDGRQSEAALTLDSLLQANNIEDGDQPLPPMISIPDPATYRQTVWRMPSDEKGLIGAPNIKNIKKRLPKKQP